MRIVINRNFARYGLIVLALLILTPLTARAQSSIAGLARDASGAVVPGVTVEVASPVLIEGTRSVATDESGRYQIVGLRPGAYTVTFTLPGFSVVKREIDLPAGFTATVSAELKVGGLEETVTVEETSPVVDVLSGTQTITLPREVMDAVPNGRNIWALAQMLPGSTTAKPDLGGTEGMQSISLNVHGSNGSTNYAIDGLKGEAVESSTTYLNDGGIEEIAYKTTALLPEVAHSGVLIDLVNKEGTNKFRGQVFFTGANSSFQSANFDDRLKKLGMIKPNSLQKMWDLNISAGGPIIKDKLWIFGSHRYWGVYRYVADTFKKDGSQVVDDNAIWDEQGHITWQINPNHKLAFWYDRNDKERYHRQDTDADHQYTDPEATYRQRTPNNYTMTIKWNWAVSNKMVVEGGALLYLLHWRQTYQPGVKPTDIARVDFITQTLSVAHLKELDSWHPNRTYSGAVSYVTGAHSFKVGLEWNEHKGARAGNSANGDMLLRFRQGVPDSVDLYNTPTLFARSQVDANLGAYAQDSWRVNNRLTLSGGARFDYWTGSVPEQNLAAGTWVPARHLAAITNLPRLKDLSPRFAVAYDLTGKGKTAIKVSASRYIGVLHDTFIQPVNPLFFGTARCAWNDLNRDQLATANELSSCGSFSSGTDLRYDPDLKRDYTWEYSGSFQHELARDFAVSVAYYHSDNRNARGTFNQAIPSSGYTPVTITNPLTNSSLVIFNQDPVARAKPANRIIQTTPLLDSRYNGMEFIANKRFSAKAFIRGGFTMGTLKGFTGSTADLNNPNSLINGVGNVGTDAKYNGKLSGAYTLPWNVKLASSLQLMSGLPLNRTYSVGRAQVPTLAQVTQAVNLLPRGGVRQEGYRLMDIRLSKLVNIGESRNLEVMADIYNLLNANYVTAQLEAVTATLGRPTAILDGRFVRLGARLNF